MSPHTHSNRGYKKAKSELRIAAAWGCGKLQFFRRSKPAKTPTAAKRIETDWSPSRTAVHGRQKRGWISLLE
jgi:hypothetical protein